MRTHHFLFHECPIARNGGPLLSSILMTIFRPKICIRPLNLTKLYLVMNRSFRFKFVSSDNCHMKSYSPWLQ